MGTDTARASQESITRDDLGLGLMIISIIIHIFSTAVCGTDAVCRRGCDQRACLHSQCAGGEGKDVPR
jgi:hypothetical protein